MASLQTRVKIVRRIRELTGIRFSYRFVDRVPLWGEAAVIPSKAMIFFNRNSKETCAEFASTVLHEVNHIIAYRNRKFWIFHRDTPPTTYRDRKIFLQTALRAERYVDRQACKMFKKLFPGQKYDWSYKKKKDLEWFLDHYLNPRRKEWGFPERK